MRIIFKQTWDNYTSTKYLEVDSNNEPIYSYTITIFDHLPKTECKLESVYVAQLHRNKGYFNVIMKEVLSLNYKKIFIQVRVKSFIEKSYRKLGFRKYTDEITCEGFFWMRKINK